MIIYINENEGSSQSIVWKFWLLRGYTECSLLPNVTGANYDIKLIEIK